ncbi:hypothetical protein BCR39DRAFT_226268 [Naematelia encephala]|uniref:Uncharacterized protein n=1 Tax=Naematelia encephala TaxID=71784 RepID=A0A1Y2AY14_9TREE|nr:hypothetical protein BCR39DRAFT_226268 [Naematelia encephala]
MSALPFVEPPTPSKQLASLPTLLSALRAHLLPKAVLGALPTTLQIFAHLQLYLGQVEAEARRALLENDQLKAVKDIDDTAGQILEGQEGETLSEKEETRLRKIVDGAEVLAEKMMAFSLAFRKTHMAILFSTPTIQPKQVLSLIDTYFPSPEFPLAQHRMLFNRITTWPEHCEVVQVTYRETVMEWYRTAETAQAMGRPRPAFQELLGFNQEQEKHVQTLSKGLLRYADQVVKYYHELHMMFADEEEEGVKLDKGEGTTVETEAQPGEEGNGVRHRIEADQRRVRTSSQSRVTAAPATATVAANAVSTPQPEASSSKQHLPQTYGPSTHHTAVQSRSPSPDSVAKLPRMDFTGLRREARSSRSRSSIGARLSSPFTPSFVHVRSDPPAEAQRSLELGGERSFSTRRSGLAVHGPRHSDIVTSTSHPSGHPVVKKRPRSSLPPVTGPDYTAPQPSFSSNVDKTMLRPFDSSRLVKRPRMSQAADQSEAVSQRNDLRTSESQENSQESVRPTTKRDKGKGREVPRMQVDVFA